MGDSTNTTTTGSADPMVKQTLDQLLGGVQDIWKTGVPTYPHSLYSPAGSTTQSAWAQGAGNARSLLGSGGLDPMQRGADSALGGISGQYGQLGANGGLTSAQQQAQSRLAALFGGYGQLGDHNGLTAGQSHNLDQENALAGSYGALAGAYDQTAPGYSAMRKKLLNDSLTGVNATFNNSGRLGGGSNVKTAVDESVNAIAPLDYQNFQKGIDNRYRALDEQQGVYGHAFDMGQTGVGNQFGALAGQQGVEQGVFNNGQTGVGNRFGALAGQTGIQSQLFNNGQTAIGNRNNAVATLGGVGAAQDANQQGILTGDANLFNAQNGNKLALLQQLLGGLTGAAPVGGQQTTEPGVPWWQQIAGLGIAGLGAWRHGA